MDVLLLVDGNALIHRAYHALPEFRTKERLITNAVYGFATMVFKAIEDFKPTHVAVCFDTPAPTFRKKIFKEYQIHRPRIEDALKNQFPLVKEMLIAAKIPYYEKEGFEADDLIGTMVKKTKSKDFRILILTGDRDIMQLIDQSTYVITPQKGLTEVKIYDEKETNKKFGIGPNLIPDFKSLAGDQSDNYKGVTGIGPKTAAQLLHQFGSLKKIYQHINQVKSPKIKEALKRDKENALLSKKLATIVQDIDVDFNLDRSKFSGYSLSLKDFFEKLEFRSLIKRFFDKEKKKEAVSTKKIVDSKKQLGLF